MRLFFAYIASALLATCHLAAATTVSLGPGPAIWTAKPQVFIVSLFSPEAAVWYTNMPELLAVNISVPGLSPLFPFVHCTEDHSICQVTTGESEVNAATTITSVVLSSKFDLTSTYFLVAGIAGVNPKYSQLGGVALSRYTVSVALQYEFDAREMPANFSTGYVGYGNTAPNQYPTSQYGTEVFEVNAALRDLAFEYASKANLSSDPTALAYGQKFAAASSLYAAATKTPSVVKCDSATSDVYYSGTLLSEAFENTTSTWTNGTGVYCMSAQEDAAILGSMVRMAIANLVDFSRIMLLRTASDFDRPPPGTTAYDNLLVASQNGFDIAVANIYKAGIEIVDGILADWDAKFAAGIAPTNYVGDIFGSLGGEPDFGPGSITGGQRILSGGRTGDLAKRDGDRVVRRRPAASRGVRRRRY